MVSGGWINRLECYEGRTSVIKGHGPHGRLLLFDLCLKVTNLLLQMGPQSCSGDIFGHSCEHSCRHATIGGPRASSSSVCGADLIGVIGVIGGYAHSDILHQQAHLWYLNMFVELSVVLN